MVEVHTLTMLADAPGITVSALSKMWSRTKGAVSQNVTKLEKKGLVFRRRDENNAKIIHLYVTEEGEKLSTAHKMYDNVDIMQTQRDLLKSCTIEEVDAFFKVLDACLLYTSPPGLGGAGISSPYFSFKICSAFMVFPFRIPG